MGNSFLNTLLSTFKGKITPLITRIRFFFSKSFWRTKVLTKFREIFAKIFDVRPKDSEDYYGVWRYLVSKRLAYAIVLAIGVISLVYLVAIRGLLVPSTDGVKSYGYKNILLKFTTSDQVIIKGRGGYKAYQGAVKKGTVTGNGLLYDKEGNLVYQGSFVNNKYEGVGSSYYKNGNLNYSGSFVQNLYEGEGKEFRESGSLLYTGEFSQSMKNGTGTLYNKGALPIYTGEFAQNEIVYSSLVGKSAADVRESYTGKWCAYEYGDDYCLYMPEITALYRGITDEESVEEEVFVDTIYVLKDKFIDGTNVCKNVQDVERLWGEPLYQGNSDAIMPEAVIISLMSKYKDVFSGPIDIDYTQEYKEYARVNSYEKHYVIYLYTFERDGLLYTFYCGDRTGEFYFYSIQTQQEGEE